MRMPVIYELAVDQPQLYEKYKRIAPPRLIKDHSSPANEHQQSPEERIWLDDLLACILCACCSFGCPFVLVESEKHLLFKNAT